MIPPEEHSGHIPVLINQIIKFLNPSPGKVFVDCTLGGGGHAKALLDNMGDSGCLYGVDADERNLEIARRRLTNYSNVHFIRNNFENLEEIGKKILVEQTKIDGILLDLGLSSLHVDEPERGFSFKKEGPLDMRFDTRNEFTAEKVLNTYSLDDLNFIFKEYGEEKFAYRIAKAIVEDRKKEKFKTTTQLANFISRIVPLQRSIKIHPATRVFQALRIEVNREIEALQKGLDAAIKIISKGGRIAVISYHSLEDRVVKNMFKAAAYAKILKLLTKKPITPSEEEINLNRRARSAKLRVAEKL